MFLNKPPLDIERSVFSSKIHLKERKTSKRASVAVSVTCVWRCLDEAASRAGAGEARTSHS